MLEEAKGSLGMAEAGKRAGAMWHSLPEEEKQPFVAMHEEDVREVLSTLTAAMAATDMPLPVTQHFPVSQWLQAIDTTMSRRSVGKVILDFEDIQNKGDTA